MKKFLLFVLSLTICLIIVDRVFGYVNLFLMRHATGGQTYCQDYICFHSNEDIIMLGSSRMRHHYNPQILEDSLGLTCYNAGEDGAGIILNYGFYKMITNRYNPKWIIYDVTNFDMYLGDDNSKYLGWLRKFYDEPGIKEIVWSVSQDEKIKNLSYLYRYNTRCIATFADYIHPVRSYIKGFSPIEGTLNYDPKQNNYNMREVDSLKLGYLNKLINDTKSRGIKLVFVASPQYDTYPGNNYCQPIEVICKKSNIPFWNYFYDSTISGKKEFFKDREHLNEKGSSLFSIELTNRLRAFISNK